MRSVPNPFLECLDCPDPSINHARAQLHHHGLAKPGPLNDPFMLRQAECFAERLEKSSKDPSPADYVGVPDRVWTNAQRASGGRTAMTDYARTHGLANACLVLLNTNEFVFID